MKTKKEKNNEEDIVLALRLNYYEWNGQDIEQLLPTSANLRWLKPNLFT